MGITSKLSPLPVDDAEILKQLPEAELLALLTAVAHITDDLEVLDDRLYPNLLTLREPQSGYTEEQQALARDIVMRGLRKFRDEQRSFPIPLINSF